MRKTISAGNLTGNTRGDENEYIHLCVESSSNAIMTMASIVTEMSKLFMVHRTIEAMRLARKALDPGLKVALVPTMGALHEGIDSPVIPCL